MNQKKKFFVTKTLYFKYLLLFLFNNVTSYSVYIVNKI